MINVSIVLYKNTLTEITSLINTLRNSKVVSEIYLVDNSPEINPYFKSLNAIYLFTGKNLGYGAAHNIAIRKTIEQNVPYHLVINPDISFEHTILEQMFNFMNINSNIGHLMPKVYYPNGEIQYLCKLIPGPFDLIFRRFVPTSWTQKKSDLFELRATGYNKIMEVPYLSGCFMFLRTEALKEVGIFDERFFMYPEDIDLTRRINERYRTVFYPEVHIIHHHAQSSYMNFRMLFVHSVNMIKYFNKWGWIFDKKRKRINKETLNNINQVNPNAD